MKTAIVYMVAGMSSRFGGKIKQFAKVGKHDETLIEISMNQAKEAGFDEIVFIVGNLTKEPFMTKFGQEYNGLKIKYAKQTFDPTKRDKPCGTVDAILSAKDVVDCPFVVCNGDDLYGVNTFKKLNEHLKTKEDCATIGYLLKDGIPEEGTVNRGIFQISEENYVKSIVETFNISKDNLESLDLSDNTLCSMNIFALNQSIFNLLKHPFEKFCEENADSRTAECLLPTEISKLIKSNDIKVKLYQTEDKWLGVTNPEDENIIREIISKEN